MLAQILTILVAVAFFGIPGFSLVFVPSPDLRSTLYYVSVGSAVLFLIIGSILNAMNAKLLPPIEDRAFYYLKSAIADLNSFVISELNTDKESAGKNLTRVADTMEAWEVGNIRFLRDVGSQLKAFRENFRGRLIPAIANGNKIVVQSLLLPLTGISNTLEMGTLGKEHFVAWNQWLTQRDPAGKEQLPYVRPHPDLLRRLASKRFHIAVLSLVVLVPIATGIMAYEVLRASVDTAVLSFSTVLAGTIVLGYLIFSQRKGSSLDEAQNR